MTVTRSAFHLCHTALLMALRDQHCSVSCSEGRQGWTQPLAGDSLVDGIQDAPPFDFPRWSSSSSCSHSLYFVSCVSHKVPICVVIQSLLKDLGMLLGSVMDNPACLCCLVLNRPRFHALALGAMLVPGWQWPAHSPSDVDAAVHSTVNLWNCCRSRMIAPSMHPSPGTTEI